MTPYQEHQVIVIRHARLNTAINGTEYVLESRLVQLPDQRQCSQYRVLLGGMIIRNWIEGEIDPFFRPRQPAAV